MYPSPPCECVIAVPLHSSLFALMRLVGGLSTAFVDRADAQWGQERPPDAGFSSAYVRDESEAWWSDATSGDVLARWRLSRRRMAAQSLAAPDVGRGGGAPDVLRAYRLRRRLAAGEPPAAARAAVAARAEALSWKGGTRRRVGHIVTTSGVVGGGRGPEGGEHGRAEEAGGAEQGIHNAPPVVRDAADIGRREGRERLAGRLRHVEQDASGAVLVSTAAPSLARDAGEKGLNGAPESKMRSAREDASDAPPVVGGVHDVANSGIREVVSEGDVVGVDNAGEDGPGNVSRRAATWRARAPVRGVGTMSL